MQLGDINMDLMSVLGTVLSMGFVIYGIISAGEVSTFMDMPSVYITIGGTIGTLLLSTRGKNVKAALKCIPRVFKESKSNDIEIIENLVEWSAKARKEGLLSLEESIQNISDSFIRKGLTMIVDGSEPETIRNILEIKIKGVVQRHSENRAFFDTGGAMGPAFGMIGTLIGLINMLKTLSDPSTIGPQMSVALVTTFYGSMLANLIFIPMSKKLKAKTAAEVYQKEMIIEGLLSIQAGENPNNLREKMISFLDEKTIDTYEDMNKKAEL